MAKKQPKNIVIKDRFLTNEKPDNPYVTAVLYFVVFFLSFLLVFVCFFQLCEVRGNSMKNTLFDRDHVLLLKTASTYKRGDIVVITKAKEDGTDMNIIKRVIATAGDSIYFLPEDVPDGDTVVHLYVKYGGAEEFTLLDESGYIAEPMLKKVFPSNFKFGEEAAVSIEDGFVYVMGDNRNHSEDSRMDGAYAVETVYSKSVMYVPSGSLLEWFLKILYHENNAAN